RGVELVLLAPRDEDVSAVSREALRRCQSNATIAAGDDGHSSVELCHDPHLLAGGGVAITPTMLALRCPVSTANQERHCVFDRLLDPRWYRWLKAGDTLAYLGLGWLSWRLADGEIHERLALVAALLSGAWLVLTRLRMGHLLKTYFDGVFGAG